jgi:hypothetical protein
LAPDWRWVGAAWLFGTAAAGAGSAAGRNGFGVSLRQNELDRGFIAFRLVRRSRIVMLAVPA